MSISNTLKVWVRFEGNYLAFTSSLPRVPYSRIRCIAEKAGSLLRVEIPQSSLQSEELMKLQDGILLGLQLRKEDLMIFRRTSLSVNTHLFDESTGITCPPSYPSSPCPRYGSMDCLDAESQEAAVGLTQMHTGSPGTSGGTDISPRRL